MALFYDALEPARKTDQLVRTLQQMEATAFTTVVFSAAWSFTEPEEGRPRIEYINWLLDAACKNTQLKVDLILDMMEAPMWIWQRYPDAAAYDTDGRNYTRPSWFHPLTGDAIRRHLEAVSLHLAQNYPGCAVAIQPVFNNEYEAKYTQEHDAFQDYSPYALAAFREWLRVRSPGGVAMLNARWGTDFRSWDEVRPPVLHNGDNGVDFSARYWDFLKFREDLGSSIYNNACAAVKRGGLQCFHHFPEFFSVLDAIYGASMFKRLAASQHTDFVIMDSNFRTPYGTLMNPHKLRIYVAAAQSYGKPIYFEAAVERFSGLDVLEAGFRNSLMAGGVNLGITNWHTRVEMNASLAAAMRPKVDGSGACKPAELVGLFLHLDSCSMFHGLQWKWARKDPLHDFVEDLAEQLSRDCSTDIAVYIELDRFLADMHTFDRVVFVEPTILYGDKELANYIRVKSELEHMPHEVHHLPTNSTAGVRLVVLQDLPGVGAALGTGTGAAGAGAAGATDGRAHSA
ncbi:hypothetical protein GPECTOR_399g226 [Gonium pectorale]|uniref:Glycoside hydrolase family 42 N-terminal domain-containing protein n=1 Tax=Gonium pectorale TaxID=33097 RepID=A0A150FVA0_GONPE|nr:hypothetical protein GPECTOR_399g226 [Gonium pectorale]|eukprot:KXZ41551.1 hypothetical protein GPECTOR_399g226 [Gonium pectorale]